MMRHERVPPPPRLRRKMSVLLRRGLLHQSELFLERLERYGDLVRSDLFVGLLYAFVARCTHYLQSCGINHKLMAADLPLALPRGIRNLVKIRPGLKRSRSCSAAELPHLQWCMHNHRLACIRISHDWRAMISAPCNIPYNGQQRPPARPVQHGSTLPTTTLPLQVRKFSFKSTSEKRSMMYGIELLAEDLRA